ncbi:MAG: uncharacterized protein KVP18_000667 [Porospora cf. gigantea A]|nr:MAG: hypothetical protein KVP18_000667 [Porospora cf. gigantea A]
MRADLHQQQRWEAEFLQAIEPTIHDVRAPTVSQTPKEAVNELVVDEPTVEDQATVRSFAFHRSVASLKNVLKSETVGDLKSETISNRIAPEIRRAFTEKMRNTLGEVDDSSSPPPTRRSTFAAPQGPFFDDESPLTDASRGLFSQTLDLVKNAYKNRDELIYQATTKAEALCNRWSPNHDGSDTTKEESLTDVFNAYVKAPGSYIVLGGSRNVSVSERKCYSSFLGSVGRGFETWPPDFAVDRMVENVAVVTRPLDPLRSMLTGQGFALTADQVFVINTGISPYVPSLAVCGIATGRGPQRHLIADTVAVLFTRFFLRNAQAYLSKLTDECPSDDSRFPAGAVRLKDIRYVVQSAVLDVSHALGHSVDEDCLLRSGSSLVACVSLLEEGATVIRSVVCHIGDTRAVCLTPCGSDSPMATKGDAPRYVVDWQSEEHLLETNSEERKRVLTACIREKQQEVWMARQKETDLSLLTKHMRLVKGIWDENPVDLSQPDAGKQDEHEASPVGDDEDVMASIYRGFPLSRGLGFQAFTPFGLLPYPEFTEVPRRKKRRSTIGPEFLVLSSTPMAMAASAEEITDGLVEGLFLQQHSLQKSADELWHRGRQKLLLRHPELVGCDLSILVVLV